MENRSDSSDAETIRAVTRLNESLLQAEEKGASEALAPLIHENFFIVRKSGARQNREQYLSAASDNANRGRTAQDIRVDPYGDSAVFTCRVMTNLDAAGKPSLVHL